MHRGIPRGLTLGGTTSFGLDQLVDQRRDLPQLVVGDGLARSSSTALRSLGQHEEAPASTVKPSCLAIQQASAET